MSNKPCVREQKATSRFVQLPALANIPCPAVEIKQEYREWLDKYSSLVPDQMFVWVLRNDYLAAKKSLSCRGHAQLGRPASHRYNRISSRRDVCSSVI